MSTRVNTLAWPQGLDAATLEPIAARHGTPFYLYSSEMILERCAQLRAAFPRVGVRYAVKANSSPAILDLIRGQGFGVDTVSPWEVRFARLLGFKKRLILYSPNNPSDVEIARLLRARVIINVDSLSLMRRIGRMIHTSQVPSPVKISLRVNLDVGAGHHPHVITAGPESKFGLAPEDIPEARRIAHVDGISIIGLHQHVGSGVFDAAIFDRSIAPLFALAEHVPNIEFIDVGGGLGTPYRVGERAIDLSAWSRALSTRRKELESRLGRHVKVLIEPGRFLVAESGVLVTRVTTIKRTADRVFVGVDSGMNHLIRPALYDAWHPLHTVTPRTGTPDRCFIVGQVCESADVLAGERHMVPPAEGDLLVLGCAGAYGFSMSSHYNLRPRPAELMLDREHAEPRLVRARERFADALRGNLW